MCRPELTTILPRPWSAIGARTLKARRIVCLQAYLPQLALRTVQTAAVATNAMQSVSMATASRPNENGQWQLSMPKATYAHVVLRGGNGKPNYDASSVAEVEAALAKAKVSRS